MKLTVNGEMYTFPSFDALDNAGVVYVTLVSLVDNGVVKLAFQYEVVHVEYVYWKFHRIPS